MHTERNMSTKTYEIFKAIVDFVVDLDTVFGQRHRSISLYRRLVSKMSEANAEPVRKHVELFTQFCAENAEAFETGDLQRLAQPLLKYSDRVYIQLDMLAAHAEPCVAKTILEHLLTINALINTDSKALALLNASRPSVDTILDELLTTVSNTIDPAAASNPAAAAMSLISSGKIASLISTMTRGVQDGSLSTETMIKKLTSIYSKATENDKNAPDISTIFENVQKSLAG